jgi:stearoyl-CoA desaturase (delta-9 desaturase)
MLGSCERNVSEAGKMNWQHNNYIFLVLIMASTVPTIICGLGWGVWKGGYVYTGMVRLVFVHHVYFVSCFFLLHFLLTYAFHPD